MIRKPIHMRHQTSECRDSGLYIYISYIADGQFEIHSQIPCWLPLEVMVKFSKPQTCHICIYISTINTQQAGLCATTPWLSLCLKDNSRILLVQAKASGTAKWIHRKKKRFWRIVGIFFFSSNRRISFPRFSMGKEKDI